MDWLFIREFLKDLLANEFHFVLVYLGRMFTGAGALTRRIPSRSIGRYLALY